MAGGLQGCGRPRRAGNPTVEPECTEGAHSAQRAAGSMSGRFGPRVSDAPGPGDARGASRHVTRARQRGGCTGDAVHRRYIF